tara:strand:+ start:240 stop:698 length:459 start_codon:yes stop_codon:yes gene_type:complete
MDSSKLESKYIKFFEKDPTPTKNLDIIEKKLNIILPSDFKQISKFYRGGFLGGLSHNAIDFDGNENNLVGETVRLRTSIILPSRFIVLAEPAASLIVMETMNDETADSKVIWLDATDVCKLDEIDTLNDPDIWNSYTSFFEYLLDEEEEERE